ncbi:MAG TPA: rhodanese-like domain-containing protein [Candidatus Ozemobacteraceae bacterium]
MRSRPGNGMTMIRQYAVLLLACATPLSAQIPAVPPPGMNGPLAQINPGYASSSASQGNQAPPILQGMCWGPCKETAYLAMLASAPNLTRDQAARMSEVELGIHQVVGEPALQPMIDINPRWLISAQTLKPLLESEARPRLVDSRSGKDDDGRRILGAFSLPLPLATGSVKAFLPDPNALVVVYGNDEKTMSVVGVAAELRRLGYANVLELREGLAGWQNVGGEILVPEGSQNQGQASATAAE